MIFRKKLRLRSLLTATALLLGGSTLPNLHACGPDFPNRYFDAPAEQIMAAPEAFFGKEVALIAGVDTDSPKDSGGTQAMSALDDVQELATVLTQQGLSGEPLDQTVATYAKLREQLTELSAEELKDQMPASVPEEFALYLEGARSYKQGDREDAARAWEELLTLPATERQHRSIWAAYMLGRLATTPEEATQRFRQVRELAAEGFSDSQDMRDASWGWEAKAYLNDSQYAEAADLYLRHYQAGAPSALNSLRMVMQKVFTQSRYDYLADDLFDDFARDATARRLWTAYLLSLGTDRYYWDEEYNQQVLHACQRWVKTLNAEDITSIDEYGNFAWLAYKSGDTQLAKEWLALAPPDAEVASWIAAKIAQCEGNLALAAHSLQKALKEPELNPYRRLIYAELGRVELALDEPQRALTAWLLGGHWEDAAYIAERVLSTDELVAYVNDRLEAVVDESMSTNHESLPDTLSRSWANYYTSILQENRKNLRNLLARRLMRDNRFDEAIAYFDEAIRPEADRYLALVRSAYDSNHPAENRAASFWIAATLAYEHGMELFGTELFPDNVIWWGNFAFRGNPAETRQELARYERGPLAPTRNELQRIEEHTVPEKRFHYRYRAATLGGWAAALLPNDSEDTADVLYTAGSWLKYRDPQAAQPFYQALVIRCPHTPLGQAAAEANWFPPDKYAFTDHTYAPIALADQEP